VIRKILGSNGLSTIFDRRRPEHIYKVIKKPINLNKMSQKEKIDYYNKLDNVLNSRNNDYVRTRIRAKWNLLKNQRKSSLPKQFI